MQFFVLKIKVANNIQIKFGIFIIKPTEKKKEEKDY